SASVVNSEAETVESVARERGFARPQLAKCDLAPSREIIVTRRRARERDRLEAGTGIRAQPDSNGRAAAATEKLSQAGKSRFDRNEFRHGATVPATGRHTDIFPDTQKVRGDNSSSSRRGAIRPGGSIGPDEHVRRMKEAQRPLSNLPAEVGRVTPAHGGDQVDRDGHLLIQPVPWRERGLNGAHEVLQVEPSELAQPLSNAAETRFVAQGNVFVPSQNIERFIGADLALPGFMGPAAEAWRWRDRQQLSRWVIVGQAHDADKFVAEELFGAEVQCRKVRFGEQRAAIRDTEASGDDARALMLFSLQLVPEGGRGVIEVDGSSVIKHRPDVCRVGGAQRGPAAPPIGHFLAHGLNMVSKSQLIVKDLALLSSSVEGVQRQIDSLGRGGIELLTVPADIPADLTCSGADGQTTKLACCQRFTYLGGLVPYVEEDLRRRRGLAWAAFRSIRAVIQSEALPDRQRARLWQAVIETVLLYNAETWTLTATLERQLDTTHSGLLRAAFRADESVVTEALPSCSARPLSCAGGDFNWRAKCSGPRATAPTCSGRPAAYLAGPVQAGSGGRTRRYVDCLPCDAGAPDTANGADFTQRLNSLTHYTCRYPEKLGRIANYLERRLQRDLYRRRTGHVFVAISIADNLIKCCQRLDGLVCAYLSMVTSLVECEDRELQILGSASFCAYSAVDKETPNYLTEYAPLLERFVRMCLDSSAVSNRVRCAGLRGIVGLVRKIGSDDLQLNIWQELHMNQIVGAVLFNLEAPPAVELDEVRLDDDEEEAGAADSDGASLERPFDLAKEALDELLMRATFHNYGCVIGPVLAHLDANPSLWVPCSFALLVFRTLVTRAPKPGYAYTVVERLVGHLNSKSVAASTPVRQCVLQVVSGIVGFAAGDSVGPAVYNVFKELCCQLARSLTCPSPDQPAERQYRQELVQTMGRYAEAAPDTHKLEIMKYLLTYQPSSELSPATDRSNEKLIDELSMSLLSAVAMVADAYRSRSLNVALPLDLLGALLLPKYRLQSQLQHGRQRIAVLAALLDRRQCRQRLCPSPLPLFTAWPTPEDIADDDGDKGRGTVGGWDAVS
uniref:RING-type domain-containing protein n=1 Tax=Macrostomum lignano TaxID=282301 RepID=A0A1I8IZB2_9PLAT